MNKFKYQILVLLFFLFSAGCKKVYDPGIDSVVDALIVEGLITDSKGPFTVKLTKAVSFGSTSEITPVNGAKIQVKDDHNQTFFLTENSYGIYSLPPNFKAVTGDSYALFIQTKKGDMYRSSPQKLLPPPSFDSIHGFVGDKEYLYETLNHDQIRKVVQGAFVLLDFKNDSLGAVPKYRFKNEVLIEWWGYSNKYQRYGYCWNTLLMDLNVNMTGPKQTIIGSETKNHSLCFLPNDNYSYDLTDSMDILYNIVLTTKQYSLTDDAYSFYKGANVQIDSDGSVFDPIAAQLYGNITCINNPEKLVFGFFEVSSTASKTYLMKMDPSSKNVMFKPAQKLVDSISADGVRKDIPHFWHG